VAQQCPGTARRIENAQVGVFLASRSRHGTAFLDRTLSLPKELTDDPRRLSVRGRCPGNPSVWIGFEQVRARELAATLPKRA
jgi:SRSO17 transposase